MDNPDVWLATLKEGKCLDEKNLRMLCEKVSPPFPLSHACHVGNLPLTVVLTLLG